MTAESADVALTGSAAVGTTGSKNNGVQVVGAMLQANFGAVILNGTGGGGLNDNRGTSLIGSIMRANGVSGTIILNGTARMGTTGERNIGVYLFNKVKLEGTANFTGTGGGGFGLNHGIYGHKKITANGTGTVNGTAGAGDGSEVLEGDFFEHF